MFSIFARNKVPSISIDDLKLLIGQINLIDIREPHECQSGMIKTAKNIPMDQLLREPQKYLMKDQKYYIVCQSGGRSYGTVQSLLKQGFDVVDVLGGTSSYKMKYGI